MKFATLHDVARAAGVSYATVDRVVNARGGVAQKSVDLVETAIKELGYERDLTAANLARKRVYRFHFLLPDDSNDFFRVLNAALIAHEGRPSPFRTTFKTTRIAAFSEAAIIEALGGITAEDTDCVCLVALDTPLVTAAVTRARKRGLQVMTLVADIAKDARDFYVGIDNLVAGKTAGRMMGLTHGRQPGCVLSIIGANRAHDHHERLEGFVAVLQSHFPTIEILPTAKSRDDAQTINQVLSDAWAKHPELTGVYNVGAGNQGLINWVHTIPAQTRPIIVIHELASVSRAALEAGQIDAVIDQKPFETIGQALRIMRLLTDKQPLPTDEPTITPAIYLCDNLPPTTFRNWTPTE